MAFIVKHFKGGLYVAHEMKDGKVYYADAHGNTYVRKATEFCSSHPMAPNNERFSFTGLSSAPTPQWDDAVDATDNTWDDCANKTLFNLLNKKTK